MRGIVGLIRRLIGFHSAVCRPNCGDLSVSIRVLIVLTLGIYRPYSVIYRLHSKMYLPHPGRYRFHSEMYRLVLKGIYFSGGSCARHTVPPSIAARPNFGTVPPPRTCCSWFRPVGVHLVVVRVHITDPLQIDRRFPLS